jgi:hypothetical protein
VPRAFTPEEIRAFFEALGESFDAPAELVVVGGAGAILRHGATRPTVDIDTYSVPVPDGFVAAVTRARERTRLIIPIEHPAVADAPWNYQERLEPVTGLNAGRLTILVPDRHDLALMKVVRSYRKDLDVIAEMHRVNPFDLDTLVRRFTDEMGHVISDEKVLRQKFLLCVQELFGDRAVEPTRETIERVPVMRELDAATQVRDCRHLYALGIRPETLADERFADAVRQAHDGTVVFPYRDLAGVTGLRLYGAHGNGSSGRLDSGLWTSRERATDRQLVIVESPLEALAYHQANNVRDARYLAAGAKLQPQQEALLVRAINGAPSDARLVLAFGAGPSAEALASRVKTIAKMRTLERHAPRGRKSWVALVTYQQREWIRSQGLRPPGRDRSG